MTMTSPSILYLVHDLSDAAVAKRMLMLIAGGARVTVAGFRRSDEPLSTIAGCPAIDLGRTYNGSFLQRIGAVLRASWSLKQYGTSFASADIVIARNLEMLALAVRGRSLTAKKPILIYESLDIHRLLLNKGPTGAVLRGLEGWLAKRASALITSSPAFVQAYFEPKSSVRLPVLMVENKVYDPGFTGTEDLPSLRPVGPPWRIGWFGIIRCRKSFALLADLVKESDGTIEVIIRGRPALDQIPDFPAVIAATPGMVYAGPYKNPDDLRAIYHDVHFTWAIDMFEEGLNSSWLLPNRLYEGGLYHTVPLARASVETGRFLSQHGIGVTLADPLSVSLRAFFQNLTLFSWQALENNAMEIPQTQWLLNNQDCISLVASLNALRD